MLWTSELRPGEINIEGLSKRYWFRSGADSAADGELSEETDADAPESGEEAGLGSFFARRRREVWALRDINCHIQPGERVALVGANGAGKSTLVRILARTLPPSSGSVEGAGIVVPFGALRSPINPRMSGCNNLRMLARLLHIPLDRLEARLPQIVDFSELGRTAYDPVARYSDSSFARLSMAMALLIDADIYLADDDIKAGDELFRRKFMEKFTEVVHGGATLVYASNGLSQLRLHCERALWLDHGRIVADSGVKAVIQRFLNRDEDLSEFDRAPAAGEASASDELETAEAPPRSVAFPAERLEPIVPWLKEAALAEKSWDKLLERWRKKILSEDLRNGAFIDVEPDCVLGTIHSLWCLNSQGNPVKQCLPGEPLTAELLIEAFDENVTIAVGLELAVAGVLFLAAEPLVPLLVSQAGHYLVRVDIDPALLGHALEDTRFRLRTRVAFKGAGDDRFQSAKAKLRLELRGNVRRLFTERGLGGEEAVKTGGSPPPPIKAVPSADGSPAVPARMDCRPILRPKLNWTIYRAFPDPAEESRRAGPDERADEAPLLQTMAS